MGFKKDFYYSEIIHNGFADYAVIKVNGVDPETKCEYPWCWFQTKEGDTYVCVMILNSDYNHEMYKKASDYIDLRKLRSGQKLWIDGLLCEIDMITDHHVILKRLANNRFCYMHLDEASVIGVLAD